METMGNPKPVLNRKQRTLEVPISKEALDSKLDPAIHDVESSYKSFTELTVQRLAIEFPDYHIRVYVVDGTAESIVDNR